MTLDANELAPAIDPDLLFPPDAAFMARTDLAGVRFLGSGPLHLDSVTAHLSGLLGERPAVRHRAGTGPEILAVYRRAGLPVREETWAYATLEEAEALADRLIERGARLVWPYPLRAGRFEDCGPRGSAGALWPNQRQGKPRQPRSGAEPAAAARSLPCGAGGPRASRAALPQGGRRGRDGHGLRGALLPRPGHVRCCAELVCRARGRFPRRDRRGSRRRRVLLVRGHRRGRDGDPLLRGRRAALFRSRLPVGQPDRSGARPSR